MGKKKSELAKVRMPSGARSDLFLALVRRLNKHGESIPKNPSGISSKHIELSARIMECVDIAYEIADDEGKEMLQEMRSRHVQY